MRPRKFNESLIVIVACLLALFIVQLYSLSYFARLERVEFHKQINSLLSKSLYAQRLIITDSISNSMRRWLHDTTLTRIYSRSNEKLGTMMYYLEDASGANPQRVNFSLTFEKRPITDTTIAIKDTIIEHLITSFRQSYISYQTVYYSTKNVGDSASFMSQRLRLDTTLFREQFRKQLVQEGIETAFQLYFVSGSDTARYRTLQDEAEKRGALQTRLYPSSFYTKDKMNYVYAVFDDPGTWLTRRMVVPVIVSMVIVLGVAFLMYHFYQVIRKQKQLAALKNDFIDNMTHELKTPIATISAAAEAMQTFGAGDDPARSAKYLDAIRSQSQQLGNIVNKVLDISTFERHDISLKRINTSITQLLNEIKADQSLLKSNTRIEIPNREISITGDPFHLRNVFFNLVDNAIKYNDKEQAVVEVSADETDEGLRVDVKDNGRGIEKDALPRLFDKFYRVPQGNVQRVKGFGLGLFYVKSIVEMHGGSISVQSEPGKHTIFSILFPKAGT